MTPASRHDLERLRMLSAPTPADVAADPYRSTPASECDHGVGFDADAVKSLGAIGEPTIRRG